MGAILPNLVLPYKSSLSWRKSNCWCLSKGIRVRETLTLFTMNSHLVLEVSAIKSLPSCASIGLVK